MQKERHITRWRIFHLITWDCFLAHRLLLHKEDIIIILKIGKIIASGGDYSNRKNGYDELSAMRDSLVVHGVPDSIIILDYQGTRTINSIVNVRYIDSITVISQKYHNERAIWLAEHYGLHAVAYNALTPDITDKKSKIFHASFLQGSRCFWTWRQINK